MFELNVNVPSVRCGPLNGVSFKNRAIWPCAGMVTVPLPKSVPLVSVKKKETVAAESFALETAKPVLAEPETSA